MMGSYAKAGLGQAVGSGLQSMGMMLLEAQDRQERRAFQEHQIKAEADDRKERREEREADRKRYDAGIVRAAKVSELAEQKHLEETKAAALERASELDVYNTGRGLFTRKGQEMPALVPGTEPQAPRGPARSSAAAGPRRTLKEVEELLPDGQVRRGLVDASTGEWVRGLGTGPRSAARPIGGGAGQGLEEGWGEKFGAEAPAPMRSTPPRAFQGPPPAWRAPMAAPEAAASRPSEDDRIRQLLSEGKTPEQVDAILTKEGY